MIHRLPSLGNILLLSAPLGLAQSSTWVPDKAHSEVDFSTLHMSLVNARGHFENIGGNIVQNESDIAKATVNMNINVSTVDTGVADGDADLKSPTFFA